LAIKMSYARTKTGDRVSADFVEAKSLEGDFSCDGNGCKTEVSHVNSHTRQHGETTHLVRACFRTKPNRAHGDNCQYDASKQLEIIARESDPEVVVRRAGTFEFRLLAISQALSERNSSNAIEAAQKPDQPPASMVFKKSDVSKLPRYLNSAMRVLKLRNSVEDDNDLTKIKITFAQQSIAWKDFYFESETYIKCAQAKAKYPRAIIGTVESCRTAENGRVVLNLKQQVLRPVGGNSTERDAYRPAIWSDDPEDFAGFAPGAEILAFGFWQSGKKRSNGAWNNYSINLDLKWKGQIAVVS
jgi:hypothetical protein